MDNDSDLKEKKAIVVKLNKILENTGVSFRAVNGKAGKKLVIQVNEKQLNMIKGFNARVGRPPEHDIDFKEVEKMKAEGKNNKEIYEELGVSKTLFYCKMKEYRNNIEHEKRERKMEYIEGRLGYNSRTKRYGFLWADLWEKDFHCGNRMQVLLDGKWIDTRIEMNSKEQWYLVGVNKTGNELENLIVRIEKE